MIKRKTRPPPRPRAYAGADEEQGRQLFFLGWCFWLVVLAFMVLRDPTWRLLHGQGLVPGSATKPAGWTELDARTVRRLSAPPRGGAAALPALEEALRAELERRRAAARGTAPGAPPRTPRLRELARTLAGARARSPNRPELRYPEVFVALQHPAVLVRTVELHQRMPALAPSDAGEVVTGWLNAPRFRGALEEAAELQAAVGVVRDGTGEWIQVLLVEPLLSLDAPLPSRAKRGDRLTLRGRRGPDSAAVYLKRPADPGFHPLSPGGAGGVFTATVPLDGPGVYALRAAVRGRLSDPLPVVVR